MIKKVVLRAMSVAALVALAVPATASATVVENGFGEAASEINAVSENTSWQTASGTWDCDTVHLSLALTQSAGSALGVGGGNAEGANGSHEGDCQIAENGVPIRYSGIEAVIELEEGGSGSAEYAGSYGFVHPLFGTIPCSFTGEAAVSYLPGSSAIGISGTWAGSGSGCPTAGTIAGDFDVFDEFGLAATLR